MNFVGLDKRRHVFSLVSTSMGILTSHLPSHAQGVRQKPVPFEAFLEKHPIWHGKVVFIEIALQTAESNEVAAAGATDVVSCITVQRVDVPACGVVAHPTFDV